MLSKYAASADYTLELRSLIMWLKVLALKLKGEKKNWEGEKLSARASFGFSIQQETKKN